MPGVMNSVRHAALCRESGTARRRLDRTTVFSLFHNGMAVTAGARPNFFFGVKNRFFFRRKRNGFCPRRVGAPWGDPAPGGQPPPMNLEYEVWIA